MINYVQPGDTLTMIAPSGGVSSGDPVLLGKIFGIAQVDALVGESFPLVTKGVFTIAKEAPLVITAGAYLYWDASESVLTTTSTDNTLVAKCVVAAASADTTVIARILDV